MYEKVRDRWSELEIEDLNIVEILEMSPECIIVVAE